LIARSEAAQQQGQKSGSESKHQYVRKLPNSKARYTDKARHQNGAQMMNPVDFGWPQFLMLDDNFQNFHARSNSECAPFCKRYIRRQKNSFC
jgi:hypothetical protein